MDVALWRRARFVQALRSRPFALLWGGQTISALGDGAYFTALAWQVLIQTHSGTAMGLMLVASSIPWLVFWLIGGIAADRLPRRLVLFWSDAGRATVLLAIAGLGWAGLLQLWHLIALGLIFGLVGAFFGPAYRAIPPQLVDVEALPSANAMTELVPNDMLRRVSSIDLLGSLGLLPTGYALAGVLTDQVGPAWVFVAGGAMNLTLYLIPLFMRQIRALE